jgi:hypothetical protein
MQTTSRAGVALLVILTCCLPAAAEFHFTVTADPRGYHSAFYNVLQAINTYAGGPGAFHITVGDEDDTIPENRAKVDQAFGTNAIWVPVVGNHEAETSGDMTWLRTEYSSGNNGRTSLSTALNVTGTGPASTRETTYSWNYGNAHFVVLNQYWNGTSDTGADGDMVSALRTWLANDLAAAGTNKAIFVIGHEPAYPQNRHIGDSLDKYPANRDAFWALLEQYDVQAYLVGHTHYYSKYQPNQGGTYQLDAGNAGNPGDGTTFFDIRVDDTTVHFDIWRSANASGSDGWYKSSDSFSMPVPEPMSLVLLAAGAAAIVRRTRRN